MAAAIVPAELIEWVAEMVDPHAAAVIDEGGSLSSKCPRCTAALERAYGALAGAGARMPARWWPLPVAAGGPS